MSICAVVMVAPLVGQVKVGANRQPDTRRIGSGIEHKLGNRGVEVGGRATPLDKVDDLVGHEFGHVGCVGPDSLVSGMVDYHPGGIADSFESGSVKGHVVSSYDCSSVPRVKGRVKKKRNSLRLVSLLLPKSTITICHVNINRPTHCVISSMTLLSICYASIAYHASNVYGT